MIAAQPTRGLDVGSIEYIHKRMVEQRDAGAAVLIVSTELDEVLAVGDRMAVMQGGQIVGIVEGEEATYEKVGMLMGGVRVEPRPAWRSCAAARSRSSRSSRRSSSARSSS